MEVKSRCIKSTRQQEKGYEVSTTKQGKWEKWRVHPWIQRCLQKSESLNVIKRKLILQIKTKTRTDIVVEAEEDNVYQNV